MRPWLSGISTSAFAIDTGEKDETESWLDTFQAGADSRPPFNSTYALYGIGGARRGCVKGVRGY